ncbi:hypothetical protein DQ238_08650 [Geodermatophilus sp. TF02-6]|nr:hypothetical protein DQ238_08650 [Geodermatophilus sp. TF02-6]
MDGAWWPGSILGWRHDGQGVCEVWVRVAVAGVEREVWTDLADLRLPARARPASAAEPVAAEPVAGSEPTAGGSAAPAVSLSEAAARERLVAGVLAAPQLPAAAAPSSSASWRRRRHGGDVTAELPAVRADTPAGRHRAPAGTGRHRAADDPPPSEPTPAPGPAPTPGSAPAPMCADATVLMARPEVDHLTRPLRLGDRLPRPWTPRRDGGPRA